MQVEMNLTTVYRPFQLGHSQSEYIIRLHGLWHIGSQSRQWDFQTQPNFPDPFLKGLVPQYVLAKNSKK